VDAKRVYIVGHSNGAFMSYRMACDHADAIAAIVSIAGASFKDRAACEPSEPVSILQIQGSADDVISPAGGNAQTELPDGERQLGDYPSTVASLESWATYDECAGELTPSSETLDLDFALEGAAGPNETTVSAFEGCAAGASVELWMIEGAGHEPRWSTTFGSTLIDYLLAHAKPALLSFGAGQLQDLRAVAREP
jgi:polyhydroxybutyrate depolymerase